MTTIALRALPLLAALALPGVANALSAVNWSSSTDGAADGIGVALEGFVVSELETADLSGARYEAAPLAADQEVVSYPSSSDWSLLLSEPVDALLVYTSFWRGIAAGVDPATYHFDVPFEILSGLPNAGTIGNSGGLTLTLPANEFHEGILLFCGPISSLEVSSNISPVSLSRQFLTLAFVPIPDTAPDVRPVDWTSPAAGAIGTLGATLANLAGAPQLEPVDFRGPAFVAEPLSFCTEGITYAVESDWTLTLSRPAGSLLLYVRQWRGSVAGGPVTYQFDAPATIVSGLDGASLSNGGTLLSLPAGFHDGILRFDGPIASLALESSASTGGSQAMTFAVPSPAVFAWPSPAPPCDATLQACIDAVQPGDVVEIVDDGPHDVGQVTIDKSLTLRAGAGFEPAFAPLSSLFAGIRGDHRVRIEGLRFLNGSIVARQLGSGTYEVAIVDNVFEASPNGGPAIEVASGFEAGPVVTEIADNRIAVPDTDGVSQGIRVISIGTGDTDGAVRRNHITMGANGQGAAIAIVNGPSDLVLDVFGNVIDGAGYQEGISVVSQNAGSMAVRIANNVVSGTAGEGSREAVKVDASAGSIEALIVNNTLAENHTAIGITGRPDLGGTFDGLVANNVMAGNERGLVVDSDTETIPDRNNLYFGNGIDLGTGADPVTPGPDSIFGMDPLLLVAQGYRPEPGSPVVDAGDTSAVPPDLATDVAGAPRILGGIVDIGAYEVPEPGGPAAAAAASAALAALASCARRGVRRRR